MKTPRHALLKKRDKISGEAPCPNNCATMMPVACDHCIAIVPATIIQGVIIIIAANSVRLILAYINSATRPEKVALMNVVAIGNENRNCWIVDAAVVDSEERGVKITTLSTR